MKGWHWAHLLKVALISGQLYPETPHTTTTPPSPVQSPAKHTLAWMVLTVHYTVRYVPYVQNAAHETFCFRQDLMLTLFVHVHMGLVY